MSIIKKKIHGIYHYMPWLKVKKQTQINEKGFLFHYYCEKCGKRIFSETINIKKEE